MLSGFATGNVPLWNGPLGGSRTSSVDAISGSKLTPHQPNTGLQILWSHIAIQDEFDVRVGSDVGCVPQPDGSVMAYPPSPYFLTANRWIF